MEFLTVLFILAPVIGYVMQQYGMGVLRQAESLLPEMNLVQARTLLLYFSNNAKWPLILERVEDGKATYIFQVGQWGLSMYGAQRVGVILEQQPNGVSVTMESLSLMGQLYDFGKNQKNLDELTVFLTGASTNPPLLEKYLTYQGNFLPKTYVMNLKYFYIIFVLIAFIVASYYSSYRDKQSAIAGNVIITFRPGYSDEDMYRWLNDAGAGSCENRPPENLLRFMCAVPVGAEDDVISAAKRNFAVETATRWHGE